jgi:hypothetical protein
MKIILKALLITASIFMLVACDPADDEAKKLGFDDVQEMRSIQVQGWHNKDQYYADTYKSKMYASAAAMKAANDAALVRRVKQAEVNKEAEARQAKENEKQTKNLSPTPAPAPAPEPSKTSRWEDGKAYDFYRGGGCNSSADVVCMSEDQYKLACKSAKDVTTQALKIRGVNAYGDEKILIDGGSVGNVDIFWGSNSKGEQGCAASVTMQGIVNGNSMRKDITGNVTRFIVSSGGELLVAQFGNY